MFPRSFIAIIKILSNIRHVARAFMFTKYNFFIFKNRFSLRNKREINFNGKDIFVI